MGSSNRTHATAQAAILPGDLIEVIPTAGADNGKVRRHATAAARAAPLFADGNWQFGKGRAMPTPPAIPCRTARSSRARRMFARCAVGTAITTGTPLESAGAGLLRAFATGVVIAEAMESELVSRRSDAGPHSRAHRRAIERRRMPVALETQALRGGPPPSILSPQGIAHLRVQASRTREAQLYTHATLLREQWVEIDNLWLRVAEQYMGAVMDLTSRGLTQTIPSLGIAASQYQAINRMEPPVPTCAPLRPAITSA